MNDFIQRGRKALQKIHKKNVESDFVFGTVGRLVDGVPVFDVVGRPTYIFVTIRQANGAQTSVPARDDVGVPRALGLPIRMRKEGTTYIVDSLAKRSDLAYIAPGQDPSVHTHDSRYFTESEFTGAADLGAPADTDKLLGVRAGGLGSLLWSALKTALNSLYVVLAGSVAQTVTGVKTFSDGIILRRSSPGNLLDLGPLTLSEGGTTLQPGFYRDADDNTVFLTMVRTVAGGTMMGSGVSGDTERRWIVVVDGAMGWGDGTNPRDTNLYRSAANRLKTDDTMVVVGNLGINVDNPQGRYHSHNTVFGELSTSKNNVNATPQIIIANGTGDVVRGAVVKYAAWDGTTFVGADGVVIANGGTHDIVVGASTYTITIAANGEMSIARSAGSGTLTSIALKIFWL